ncbi:hypothetical protein BJ508DRAFT_358504 [Ascobolus immersus RN42]|uniref:Rhodopsin domain-containing protein n=1 Tax=Ascobolus immersus RN42 TaxID=1160509 RepID=A0A3N4III5_ASCIM|nr:hypothetical protein BJ508DRAFT_358504 [Ascobolus immersus RN42]
MGVKLEPTSFLALEWGVVVLVSALYAGRTAIIHRYTGRFTATDGSDIPLWGTFVLYMSTAACLTWYCTSVIRARKLPRDDVNAYYNLPEDEVVVQGKIWLFLKVMYIVATWLSRATFLTVYINVRKTLQRGAKWLLWATVGWCAIGTMVDVVLTLAWCQPISSNWRTDNTRCTPWNITTTTIHCIFALGGDILIMIVPIFILKKLKLQRSQRAAIAFVMFIGVFCCALAIMRFALIVFNARKKVSKNHTYEDLDLLVAVVECALLCIASTLPAYRLIFTVRRRASNAKRSASVGNAAAAGFGIMDNAKPLEKRSGIPDESLLESTLSELDMKEYEGTFHTIPQAGSRDMESESGLNIQRLTC